MRLFCTALSVDRRCCRHVRPAIYIGRIAASTPIVTLASAQSIQALRAEDRWQKRSPPSPLCVIAAAAADTDAWPLGLLPRRLLSELVAESELVSPQRPRVSSPPVQTSPTADSSHWLQRDHDVLSVRGRGGGGGWCSD